MLRHAMNHVGDEIASAQNRESLRVTLHLGDVRKRPKTPLGTKVVGLEDHALFRAVTPNERVW